ncbi:LPXTG cell wall anchor domain-containing protein [Arthrobacter psychrolactophilus]
MVTREAMGWTVIAAPVIISPADGSITGDRPVFTGTGYPGADISIVHGRSGLPMCTTKAEADGTFSCPMDRPLMVGSLEVFPSVSANGVGSVAGKMITIAVEVSPTILRPAQGAVVPEFPVIEGTAGARSNVAIEDEHGATICSTVADEMGIFGCAVLDAALTPGPHTLTPVQTSFAGIVVRGAAASVTVPGTVPGVTPSASPSASTTSATPAPSATKTQTTAATSPAAVVKTGTTRALAATGATGTTPILLVGGLLILLGAAVVVARIRRRSRDH